MARDKAAAQKSEESWKKYMAEKGEGGGLVFGGEEGGRGNGDNAYTTSYPQRTFFCLHCLCMLTGLSHGMILV
jgi:hypothetical protein